MADRPTSDQLPPPSNLTDPDEFNKYHATNALERYLVSNFMSTLNRSLPSVRAEMVLEVGVGEGHVSEQVVQRFPEAEIVGIDLPHDTMFERWRTRGVNGVFADAHRLPFVDDSFDLVLAIEVLEHLPDPDIALEEIARVARGGVVLSVPLEPLWRIGNMLRGRYLSDWGDTPDHIQHWSRGGFRDLVENHLEIVAIRNPLPWTMVVARAR